ncbi:MAG: 2OG-Fe(II) oxygenase [Candidatus Competibacteraceae bacterium]|nr:2OG-Fe(II) oxygenase [Candidatus Competibacteraceae bacterium]MCP5127315.1 2OG-Fe(II) oxygenase [Gammaproteobacteria bacterium]HRX69893.1 2OG-Fe(II) oxygenase [Candidatus Competibacteraceae bacterium]
MSFIAIELAKALSAVDRPGDFCINGVVDMYVPQLEVEGIGPIALPLLPVQAQQLIAVAEQAPYGRGAETLIDTRVRRTWQIDAEKIHLKGKYWSKTLEDIVSRAAASLGVTAPVVAELYKMLVYDQDSFFVSHRDTEKAPGMFATLIIVLPSTYTGGELLIRHRDQERECDLRSDDPAEITFAAFYADCVHEIRPITSGCRLTLVYNLLRQGKGPLPKPPDYETEQALVANLLQQWNAAPDAPDDDSPDKLIYPLEHAYTPAELFFDALKGADGAVADLLIAGAAQADCDLHLTLITIEESGEAIETGYYGRRRWSRDDEDEDDFEIGEIYDRSAFLSHWQRPDNQPSDFGRFPFGEEELCPPGSLDNLEPDEVHFQEATGNEGASFERTYHRAAFVLWPRQRRLAVLNQAGLSMTLPCLREMVDDWKQGGQDPASPLWSQAHELSGLMLNTWPRSMGWRSNSVAESAQILDLLTELRDIPRIEAFLTDISAEGVYSKGDNEALIRAVDLLPAPRAAELIEHIIAGNTRQALGACGDLLVRYAEVLQKTGGQADLLPAATLLFEALPGDPVRIPETEKTWSYYRSKVESRSVADVMIALAMIDAELANRAVDYLLAWPETYGLDAILIPALLTLVERPESRDSAAIQRLRTACLNHLKARIAEPLAPPSDWARPSQVACQCAHCRELSLFLADPQRESWALKAVEATRSHVENSIRSNHCDLDYMTQKVSRPYSLICAKNRASYERRVQQRDKDLMDMAKIDR